MNSSSLTDEKPTGEDETDMITTAAETAQTMQPDTAESPAGGLLSPSSADEPNLIVGPEGDSAEGLDGANPFSQPPSSPSAVRNERKRIRQSLNRTYQWRIAVLEQQLMESEDHDPPRPKPIPAHAAAPMDALSAETMEALQSLQIQAIALQKALLPPQPVTDIVADWSPDPEAEQPTAPFVRGVVETMRQALSIFKRLPRDPKKKEFVLEVLTFSRSAQTDKVTIDGVAPTAPGIAAGSPSGSPTNKQFVSSLYFAPKGVEIVNNLLSQQKSVLGDWKSLGGVSAQLISPPHLQPHARSPSVAALLPELMASLKATAHASAHPHPGARKRSMSVTNLNSSVPLPPLRSPTHGDPTDSHPLNSSAPPQNYGLKGSKSPPYRIVSSHLRLQAMERERGNHAHRTAAALGSGIGAHPNETGAPGEQQQQHLSNRDDARISRKFGFRNF